MRSSCFRMIGMLSVLLLLSGSLSRLSAQDWTTEDKETWKKAIERVVTTPPCCGACSVLEMREGRKAYPHVIGDE